MDAAATADPKPEVATALGSDFERLKARQRRTRKKREPLELDIPGYGGEFVGKYRLLEIPEIRKKRLRMEEEEEAGNEWAQLNGAMDNISMACIGIFLRTSDGSLVPINDYDREKYGDEPVRWDSRLAEFFGIEADESRAVIRGVFPEGEDLAIVTHSQEINLWLAGGVEEDSEGFSEASPTTQP